MESTQRIAILAVLAVLLATPALAAESFSLELVTIEESILPGESALFELHVTNAGESEDRYTVSSEEYGYILFVDGKPGVLAPGETGVFELEISPRSFVNTGTHRVPIHVRARSGESDTASPIIFIRDPDQAQGEYTPSIALSVSAPEQVDPREDLTLNVHLRNRNARSYNQSDPLTVVIESDIFRKSYVTQLGPVGLEGEKSSEVRIDLDPYQQPGSHPLHVEVRVQNRTVSEYETAFSVVDYSDVERVEYDEGGLFKHTTLYKLRNDGNVPQTARIEYAANALMRPFLSSTHNYNITDGSLVITQELDPLEEETVGVTENYRLLALLVVLVVLSIIGYYLLRSPVVIGKEAVLSGTPEDGVSKIKVRILVKNRSSKTMRNLRVIDRISGMADIEKHDGLGTLKPTKVVKKKGRGTLLRWDIDQLEPFEERIISYEAKTPLKLVGDVTLPAGKVKYDVPSGRERTSHSNEVSITRVEK